MKTHRATLSPAPYALSRRDFLKQTSMTSAGILAASSFPFVRATHAAPDDPIRIGLVGCGGRGTGATADALGAATKSLYPEKSYHAENVAEGAIIANKSI